MDALIILVLIGWGISALSRAAAKRKTTGRRQPDGQAGPSPRHQQTDEGRMRPADVDLPGGQATMPIHWEGTSQPETQSISSPPPSVRSDAAFHHAERIEWEGEQRQEENPRPSEPVTIPGLGLRLDADTLVKGVIFSEILNRRDPRRRR